MTEDKLWFEQPAAEWKDGLPIGTGRLAAMVLGDPGRERLALNHEWLWRGTNRCRDTEPRADRLAEVRRLLLDGQWEEGTRKGAEAFGSLSGQPERPNRVDPYQPAGDLHFELDHAERVWAGSGRGEVRDYRRELDLSSGLCKVDYAAGHTQYRREYLAHLGCDLILVRIRGSVPFGGKLWLDRAADEHCLVERAAAPGLLALEGVFTGGIAFRVEARAHVRGGQLQVDGEALRFSGAEEVLISVDVGTSATGMSPVQECRQQVFYSDDWETLLGDHQREYTELYGGLDLSLEAASVAAQPAAVSPTGDIPTDRRLAALRDGKADPGLILLYFNYARYLMVASTATAELPPNLQGKWNEDLDPPWQCDYHHDVNLQMNYWPAEAGHLQYATEPLFQHIERFVPHARKAARDLYGCNGVWFPIQSDAWGRATPESYGWAVWIGAAAWLAQHLWWHWEYGQDRDFLRQRAYPFLKEVAAFYESYLIDGDGPTGDGRGQLQIVPSQSPENRFVGGGDLPVTLCVSATMDVVLVRQTLECAARAAQILGVDTAKRATWADMIGRLPPLQIGRHGQLQEWLEDFEEVEPGHRHYSHLVGLYPGDQLDPETTPQLWEAARVSIARRLQAEGGHTGWSRAWTACFFARLGEAEPAWEHLCHLVTDFATDSLLDLHPPRIFQIEGNFGGAAAVLEMLLQSYRGELHLLPALPAAWPSGQVRGLRARGGFEVDVTWSAGALTTARIRPANDGTCTISHGAGQYRVGEAGGAEVESEEKGHRLTFPVEAGECYTVTPREEQ